MASMYDIYNAAKEGDVALQEILKNSANNIDVKDVFGETALHLAAYHGLLQAAQLLVSSNASVHAKGNRGQTPVHLAAEFGENSVLKLLLDNSSSSFNSVSAVDKDKNTPLHVACARHGKLETVTILLQNSEEDIKSLVSATNKNQETPFQLAVNSNKEDSVKFLLEFFSNPSASDKDKNTPLHLEINGKCDIDAIKLMLRHSDDAKSLVGKGNENQETPLHLAAKKGESDTVRHLLRNSDDFKSAVNATNKNQETPIQLAMTNKKHSIAAFMTKCETLGKNGIKTNILVNPTDLHSLVFFNDFKGIDSALQVRDSFEITY